MASKAGLCTKVTFINWMHPIQGSNLRSRMSVAQWLHPMSWPVEVMLSFTGGKWPPTSSLFPAYVIPSVWHTHECMPWLWEGTLWRRPAHEIWWGYFLPCCCFFLKIYLYSSNVARVVRKRMSVAQWLGRNANLDEELRVWEKKPREKVAQWSRKRGSPIECFLLDTKGEEDVDLRERNNPF